MYNSIKIDRSHQISKFLNFWWPARITCRSYKCILRYLSNLSPVSREVMYIFCQAIKSLRSCIKGQDNTGTHDTYCQQIIPIGVIFFHLLSRPYDDWSSQGSDNDDDQKREREKKREMPCFESIAITCGTND